MFLLLVLRAIIEQIIGAYIIPQPQIETLSVERPNARPLLSNKRITEFETSRTHQVPRELRCIDLAIYCDSWHRVNCIHLSLLGHQELGILGTELPMLNLVRSPNKQTSKLNTESKGANIKV